MENKDSQYPHPPPPQYGFQGVQAPVHTQQPQAGVTYVARKYFYGFKGNQKLISFVLLLYLDVQANVGPNPSNIQCPSCRAQILTRMDYESSNRTHLAALILCCFV